MLTQSAPYKFELTISGEKQLTMQSYDSMNKTVTKKESEIEIIFASRTLELVTQNHIT